MKLSSSLTDDALLGEIGRRLAERRLALGFTQAELAREAGLAKRTVERIESGASAQLSSVLRLLRSLGLVERFDAVVPEIRPSPIELLEHKGERRRRAPKKPTPSTDEPWTWGEDT